MSPGLATHQPGGPSPSCTPSGPQRGGAERPSSSSVGAAWKHGLPLSKVPAPCLGGALGLKPGQRQAWGPCGPLECLRRPARLRPLRAPWVMMAVCAGAALVSGTQEVLLAPPKGGLAAARRGLGEGPASGAYGQPSAAPSPGQQPCPATCGDHVSFLLASCPLSCPCLRVSPRPAASVPGRACGLPRACPYLPSAPEQTASPGACLGEPTLPGGSGAGCGPWARPDRAEALFDHPVAPRAWIAWLGAQPLGWRWAADRTAVKLRISGCGLRFSPGVHRSQP